MSKLKSNGGSRGGRKRLVWILALAVLIVVVIVYETKQELQKEVGARDGADEIAENADTASAAAKRARARVRGYYRSHDLPLGWRVGDTEFAAPNRLEVSLYFAPRIGDSRYGKAAARGDINAANACPGDATLAREIEPYAVWIRVNDKTGLIERFACPSGGAS